MTPIIVSAKTAAIILAGVTACFNHLKAPGAGFQPGWESCVKLIAFESNMETQDQADATARADATDRVALAAANRIVDAGGKTPGLDSDALRERVTELEKRLAAAEARIAVLEMRPPAILPPVFIPAPPIYPAPCTPPYPWTITTCGQQETNGNGVMFTGQHSVVS